MNSISAKEYISFSVYDTKYHKALSILQKFIRRGKSRQLIFLCFMMRLKIHSLYIIVEKKILI
jgi:hypothetical protein